MHQTHIDIEVAVNLARSWTGMTCGSSRIAAAGLALESRPKTRCRLISGRRVSSARRFGPYRCLGLIHLAHAAQARDAIPVFPQVPTAQLPRGRSHATVCLRKPVTRIRQESVESPLRRRNWRSRLPNRTPPPSTILASRPCACSSREPRRHPPRCPCSSVAAGSTEPPAGTQCHATGSSHSPRQQLDESVHSPRSPRPASYPTPPRIV
jgi:hypothetical protein